MPTITFGSGPAKNLGLTGGFSVPEEQKFPVGTLIPYYGNDPGLPGWTRYAAADGRCIYGYTTNYTNLGTVAAAINPGVSFSGTTGSSGAHLGSNVVQNIYSTGTIYACNASDGAHTHTASGGATVSGAGLINTQKITFLRANQSTAFLPTNSLVIKQTQPNNSIAFVGAAGSNFLVGANNDQTFTASTGSVSVTASPIFSTSGYHTHSGTARGTTVPTGQRFYAYYLGDYVGAHTHTAASSIFTQSQIAHKLVNLWQLTAAARTSTDTIVMYVNNVAPPAPWVLCNGLNGTPNLGNYIIGYSNNQWDIVKTSDASATSTGSISSAYLSHSHNSAGYSPANLAQTSYAGIVTNGQHNAYGWSHTHTNNTAVSVQGYVPPRINVAFIQYKG